MQRRDFLLLRTSERETVAELDGHALYMRSLDAALTHRTDDDGAEHPIEGSVDWLREATADLAQRLETVTVLRVRDREWLGDGALGRGVNEVLAAFRQRGGRVVYTNVTGSGTVTPENAAASAIDD
jgi:hypothetical protein